MGLISEDVQRNPHSDSANALTGVFDAESVRRIYEARWTDKARKAYFASHPHRFADPEHEAYPIKDASDVKDAAHLVGSGRGSKAKIKAAIIRIAREMKLEHALPASWQENKGGADDNEQDGGAEMRNKEAIQVFGQICEASRQPAADESHQGAGHDVRVTVVKGGKSINGFYYDQNALAQIASMLEGARAYADHGRSPADEATRSVRDMVGFYRDAQYIPNDPDTPIGRVEATLHVMEAASWLWSMIEEAISLGKPDLVGVSIDIFGIAEQDSTLKARKVSKVLSLNSCDVVTRPSAGGAFQRILHDESFSEDDDSSEDGGDMGKRAGAAPIVDAAEQSQVESESGSGATTATPEATPTATAITESQQTQPNNVPTTGAEQYTSAADGTSDPRNQEAQRITEAERAAEAQRVTEAESLLAELRQEKAALALDRCATTLERRLMESILPAAAQANIRERFAGRIFETSELEREIGNMQTMLAGMTSAGLIRGHGYEKPEIGSQITEAEKIQAAFDSMFDLEIDRAKYGNIRGFTSIHEAYTRVTGDSQISGFSDRSTIGRIGISENAPFARISEADTTTASFSYLLGTSMNKRLLKDYQAWPAEWQKFVVIAPIKDFKQQSRVRLGAFGSLSTVPEDTAYQSITLQDTAATYVPTKRGNLVTVSRETIINDDLYAIRQIPTKLAVAAAYTLAEFVYAFLSANPNIFDGSALFTTGAPHSNLGTANLSSAGMQTGVTAMREQTNMAGKRLGLKPSFLIVPPELEFTAMVVTKSAGVPGSANNDINPMLGYVTPIVSPQLTDANKWYMAADPRVVDTIEIGFVGGQVNPVLLIQDSPLFGANFTQDSVSYKVRHEYGGAVLDWRGLYRGQ